MAIYFETHIPNKLLAAFKKAIDIGQIITWKYDQDGDFTHDTDQWRNQAWLRPKVENGRLALYILKPKNKNISTEIYAIYHGRFAESMLAHFDKSFTNINTTAQAEGSDRVA